ncbi:MFS transporter, putative Lincomycin resistance protein, Lincomycin:H+ antiporter, LmrB [Bifidobacterium coryneforme]|uniref:MFS transporter, putative Lincomycin resistance protein, Lincomycin:H+ antiporter, LmrB n=1 Tax=Bifidobacterium coryneforme TaxID=1687 RepID=A0ABD4AFB3_9BIFI|nr:MULTISPECIES: MDR family MFS transporter [Bifidobacterium]KJY53904.1 MFS transporter, putative Lincomycin resistance protein, Lincomycin:H+ antiporter, LmrB [Bifidobacterium coryneforme]
MRKKELAKQGRTLSKDGAFINGKLTHEAFISLSILTAITFLGNFTQLQLASALPTIVHEFGISLTTGQWLTSVFQLVMGVMVPLTGFLTKRFSTREIVITSMTIFTLGSLLSWQSQTFALVLLGRILEAVGTGTMWPVLQITVFSIYPLSKRGMAMGTVGLAMSVAPAIGPTLGGWQTDANGWRSIFLTLSICGAVALILSICGLRNFGERDTSVKADFFSVALSIFGFGGLMFGFTNIENYPITSLMTWPFLIVGLAGIVWFVLRQLHHTSPLLNLRVLKIRNFTVGTIIASMSFFAFSSVTVILPMYIQTDRGYSATMSGLVMLPGAIGTAIAQFLGGRLLDRWGARPVALTGCSVLCLGTVALSMVGSGTWIGLVSICQFVRQIGMGFTLMPLTTWSLNNLAPKDVSAGSAVTNTARQIAGAVGAPILVIVMDSITTLRHSALGGGPSTQIASNIFGIQWALRISALICLGMVLLVYFGVRGNGAGSGRQMTRMVLRHIHVIHAPAPKAAAQETVTTSDRQDTPELESGNGLAGKR